MNASVQSASTALAASTKRSALVTLAERMGVEADQLFLQSLRQVAFKSPNASNEQLLALCVVANQYRLNPFLKELYAFPDKGGGIVPIVSVDGWTRIINEQEQYDGYDVKFADETVDFEGKHVPAWCEISIYRKDRSRPTVHREWFDEVRRNTDPWRSHPRRMLEHKGLIQTARRAFGFAGIYDPDEGERIIEGDATRVVASMPATSRTEQAKVLLAASEPTPVEQEPAAAAPASAEPISDAIPQYDIKSAIAALRRARTAKALRDTWDSIVTDYRATDRELPIDIEAVYNELTEQ